MTRFQGSNRNLVSVDAPDATTAIFHLKTSEAPFPTLLTQIPLFKPVDGLTKTSMPIGTGPFKMISWTPNVEVKLVGASAQGNGRFRAGCTITFDDIFVVHDVKLIENRGRAVHAAGYLAIDRYQGNERVQLRLIDIAIPQ